MQRNSTPCGRPAECGFSMIEVLVTLMIISLALLGTAGLQVHSMRLNQGGQYRSLAVFLAADLAERLEVNRVAALAEHYDLATTTAADFAGGVSTPGPSGDCSAMACNPWALANHDLVDWQGMVAKTLPLSSWSVLQTVTGARHDYTITIGWVDRPSRTTRASASANSLVGSNASASGEKFFYTANRTLFN